MKRFKYLILSLFLCVTPCVMVGCKKESNTFSVEIPDVYDGCGYEIVLPDNLNGEDGSFEIKEDGSYVFTLIIDEMYDLSQVVVKANGQEINVTRNTHDNTITITNSNINSDTKYTVHNLVKKQLNANFDLVKYYRDNLSGTTSNLGLDEILVKIGNKEYSLNDLIESNVNLFAQYGEEIKFLVKSTVEDKYSNLEKLFVVGCDKFTYDNSEEEYVPNSKVSYLVKGLTKDEEGWLPFSLRIIDNTKIYINNECLKIDQKYLIQESGLDIKDRIETIYGKSVNILDNLTNPNKISLSLINLEFFENDQWSGTISTNAGEYRARITFAGNDLFKPFAKEFTYLIEKRNIVYNILDSTIQYNESLKVSILENKQLSMGFVNASDVDGVVFTKQILDDNNDTYNDTIGLNVGNYKINIIATSDNYNIIFNNMGNLVITPANLPNNIVTVENIIKTYDNEYSQINANLLEEFKGIVSVVYKSFVYNGTVKEYSTPTLNPPKFKDVYNGGVDIEITNANYNTQTITVDVNITKAVLSNDVISVENIEVSYDGNSHAFDVVFDSSLNKSDFVVTYNGSQNMPVVINANEDDVTYYNIVISNQNYEDFILTNKYIKINKANAKINKLPSFKTLYVGDSFTIEKLNTDYEIVGINDEVITGSVSILEEVKIVSTTQTIGGLSFVSANSNYNDIEFEDYSVSATQLTMSVPKGLIVKDAKSLELFNEGVNNVDNNTTLLISIDEVVGCEINKVKANNTVLQFEGDSVNYVVDCENVELVITYSVNDLVLTNLENLVDIKYNYGGVMGERSVTSSHPLASNYSYTWYKLKNNNDFDSIKDEVITEEIISEKFKNIDNNTNTLKIYNCNENGFYIVKVESKITDFIGNAHNLIKYSNIVSVTTQKLRSYILEAPTYLATTGDLVKDITFSGGKVVTETGVVVAGKITAININDDDVVDEDGIMVEFTFVPSDLDNFYFDQDEEDGIQNYSMNIVKNCYVYTFIYNDNTKVVINVEQGKAIKFPESTEGSGSWKIQGTGRFFTQGATYIVGETNYLEVKDLVFITA